MKLNAEAEALLSEPGNPLPTDKFNRPSCAAYTNVHEKFDSRKSSRQFSRQYAHSYSVRLWSVRPKLEKLVEAEWPGVPLKKIAELCEFSQGKASSADGSSKENSSTDTDSGKQKTSDNHGQNIVFREDVTVAVIGTVFKCQPEKPSILQELAEENLMVPVVPKTKYISDQDTIQLEDETTRVQLIPTTGCGMTVGSVVNGIVCAVMGKPNSNGKFEVKEVIFPTPVPKPLLDMKMETEMVFVSGLDINFGDNMPSSSLRVDMLFDYLEGLSGCPSEIENTIRKRTKVFFVGNSFANCNSGDGKDHIAVAQIAKKLDGMLDQISQVMDVFILPGENDPSEPMLPQFPLHRCMFSLSSRRSTFVTLANPVRLEIPCNNSKDAAKLDILLSSGQNVKDGIRNSETSDPLEMARKLLQWGHLCPTAPDTLPLHPGVEDDVFVLENLPHVFAVGNQTVFDAMEWKNTKIFTIPNFSETGTVVVLNSEMDIVPLKFDIL